MFCVLCDLMICVFCLEAFIEIAFLLYSDANYGVEQTLVSSRFQPGLSSIWLKNTINVSGGRRGSAGLRPRAGR